MGIHYTYGANKNAKLMGKKAKREKKLAEKRAKRQAKEGKKKEVDVEKSLDISKPITLDFLTNPDIDGIRNILGQKAETIHFFSFDSMMAKEFFVFMIT